QTREILTPFDADQAEQKLLEELLRADFDTVLTMNQSQRRNLLDVLLRFYATHIETFGEMKSLAVVREMVN
ncbi:MAG: DNA repair protein RecO, partial [bacterium]